jgi:hypothetical protein
MFGAAPEWFISRDASRADIIGFALVVALLPAAVLTLVGVASRALGDRARDVTHIVLVTACAGLGVWRAVHDPTGGRTWALPALAVGTAGAGLVGGLRARAGTRNLTARYLRFASIGGLVFLVQFLWLSPVGRTLLTPAAAVDADAMAAVAQALGSDPPPVVVVLLDELPTASLTGGVPRHRRHRGPHPGAARRDVLTPPASGRARSYLRNLLVVLSASTLPPVWQVGQ